ncbi:MAG: serine hydrolase [Candidatus Cybelea sp.]
MMLRRAASFLAFSLCTIVASTGLARAYLPPPFAALDRDVRTAARQVPGAIALDVLDLNTGYHTGFNAGMSMPAASTIKLAVMVEVFEALETGSIDLNRRVTLRSGDKDSGSGDLSDDRPGRSFPVSVLLAKMIDISDNTATNMLIRLVGRRNINSQMRELGLSHTHLSDDVRTDGWSIRQALRTSPADLVHLLMLMARGELIDQWSSDEMISLLEADRYKTLLPEPLPNYVAIAHKTGSLFDTLNDAGIVYASDAPYVIAVMTTALPSQDLGRTFIHTVSRLAYADELRFARWREAAGTTAHDAASPDVPFWGGEPYWSGGPSTEPPP